MKLIDRVKAISRQNAKRPKVTLPPLPKKPLRIPEINKHPMSMFIEDREYDGKTPPDVNNVRRILEREQPNEYVAPVDLSGTFYHSNKDLNINNPYGEYFNRRK